jgi:hypothetical protein
MPLISSFLQVVHPKSPRIEAPRHKLSKTPPPKFQILSLVPIDTLDFAN